MHRWRFAAALAAIVMALPLGAGMPEQFGDIGFTFLGSHEASPPPATAPAAVPSRLPPGVEGVASHDAGQAECQRRLDENVTALQARFAQGASLNGGMDFTCVVVCDPPTAERQADGTLVLVPPDPPCRLVTNDRRSAPSWRTPTLVSGFIDDGFSLLGDRSLL